MAIADYILATPSVLSPWFAPKIARPDLSRGRAVFGLWRPIELNKALLTYVANHGFTTLGLDLMPPSPQSAPPPLPLVLFDLDGTLLMTSGAGARAMERAGKRVWGQAFSVAAINFGGSLDPVIIREATSVARLEFTHKKHLEFRGAYAAELRIELARPQTRAQVLPGVLALLERLRASRLASVGLLTGNYEETGCQKLIAAGIQPAWFSPRIWGDAAPTRPGLVKRAMELEKHSHPSSVIVVGDTVRDVHCAKANGCRVLAVATGSSSNQELVEAGADLVVDDLRNPAPLLDMIAGT